MVQKFKIEKLGVEKFMVEKSGVERSKIEAWGTVPIAEILSGKNAFAWVSMFFT